MFHRVGLRRAVLCGGLVVCGVLFVFAQEPAKEGNPLPAPPAEAAPASGPEAEAKAFLTAYLKAFNDHKAVEVAAMWSANGTHVDHVTGDRAQGSAAIQADIEEAFKRSPRYGSRAP